MNDITRDIFRMSLAEAIRYHKRSPLFRHVLFAVGECHDPLEPAAPFVIQDTLPAIEHEWCFRRDAVPDYIRLSVGRSGRSRCIEKLTEEYALPPAMVLHGHAAMDKGRELIEAGLVPTCVLTGDVATFTPPGFNPFAEARQ